jgi:hypothetical protein
MTFEGGFEGESIKLIDQYVGRKFIIVLAVSTVGQMATGICCLFSVLRVKCYALGARTCTV